jgi:tetratricopeptide (TPR) repeat protein
MNKQRLTSGTVWFPNPVSRLRYLAGHDQPTLRREASVPHRFGRDALLGAVLSLFLATSALAASGIRVISIDSPAKLNTCPQESVKCLDVTLIGEDGKAQPKPMAIREGTELPLQQAPTLLVPEQTTLVLESFHSGSAENNRITLKPNTVFKIRNISDRGESFIVQAGQALFKVSRDLMKNLDFFSVSHRDIDAYVRGTQFEVDVDPRKTETITVTEGKVVVERPARIKIEEGDKQEAQIKAVDVLQPGKQDRLVIRIDIDEYIKTFKTLKDAEDYYRGKLKEDEASGDPDRVLNGLDTLGFLLSETLGKPRDGLDIAQRELVLAEGRGDAWLGAAFRNLGVAYDGLGEYRKAIEYHEKSLTLLLKLYPDSVDPGIAVSYINLGFAYLGLGEYRKAIEYDEKSLALLLKQYPDGVHPDIAMIYNNLGKAYYGLGEYRKAIEYDEKSLALNLKLYPDGVHPDIETIYRDLNFAYQKLGDTVKANEYTSKADELKAKLTQPR